MPKGPILVWNLSKLLQLLQIPNWSFDEALKEARKQPGWTDKKHDLLVEADSFYRKLVADEIKGVLSRFNVYMGTDFVLNALEFSADLAHIQDRSFYWGNVAKTSKKKLSQDTWLAFERQIKAISEFNESDNWMRKTDFVNEAAKHGYHF